MQEGQQVENTLNIRIDEVLKRKLRARAKGQHRSPSDQARRYLEIAMIAEENPDLPFSFIEGILEARAEIEAGLVEELDRSSR
jgi:plasmid stability protein